MKLKAPAHDHRWTQVRWLKQLRVSSPSPSARGYYPWGAWDLMGCAPDSQLLKFTLSYQATNHDCRHISQLKLPTSSSQSPSSCPQAVPSTYHELRAFPKRPFDIDGSKYIKDWEALKPDGNFQWNIFYLRKYQSAISKCFTDVLILIFIFFKRTKFKSFSIRLK